MTREDVMRLARDAGSRKSRVSDCEIFELDQLERFAALVAAHEREECAQEVEACTSSDVTEQYHIGIMTAVAAISARGEQE